MRQWQRAQSHALLGKGLGDDPRRRRLVGEDDVELGEFDLCLLARRGPPNEPRSRDRQQPPGRTSRRNSVTAV